MATAAMAEPAWSWPAAPVKTGASVFSGFSSSGFSSSGASGATDGWTDGWTEASPSSGLVGDGESSPPAASAMAAQIFWVVWRVSVMVVRWCFIDGWSRSTY